MSKSHEKALYKKHFGENLKLFFRKFYFVTEIKFNILILNVNIELFLILIV